MNIGVFINPKTKASHRLEISNNEEFIERVRQVNAEAREQGIKWPIRHWKIRHLGDNGKTPAAIQKLIDQSNATGDEPKKNLTEKLAAPGLDEQLLPETTNTAVEETKAAFEEIETLNAIDETADELAEMHKNGEGDFSLPEPDRDSIEGEVKPREKPRINPFTGEPQ
jgi:hypothetical protein